MSQDAIVVNPFSLIFDALWSMLESSPLFIADIAAGNRIHYNRNNDRNPYKTNIQDSDLPELILIPNGFTASLFNTSSTSKVLKKYSWLLSTGDVRINNWLHQIEFDVMCCLTGWQNILGALIWPLNSGKNFCKRFDVIDINEGLSDPERNRSVVGWSAVWTCEVECHFQSSDLIAYRGY